MSNNSDTTAEEVALRLMGKDPEIRIFIESLMESLRCVCGRNWHQARMQKTLGCGSGHWLQVSTGSSIKVPFHEDAKYSEN